MNCLKPLNKRLENKINSMAPIISTTQLKHLAEHKYTSQGTSLLEPYFQPFWCYVVEQIPATLAPNLITIIGLIINVFTCMIMFLHSPTGLDYIPGWACMLCAIGLFVYQTLDAIDGKQARRTQSSSPLGELFDHGCDAVSTVFVTIALCLSSRINTVHPWAMLCMCVFAMSAFYVAHWQTYVTGVLRFGKMDCTEAQLSMYTFFVLTALFGDSLWSLRLPFVNVELRLISFVLCITGSTLTIINHLVTISKGGVGKNLSSVANTSIIFPHMPLTLVFLLEIIIARKSTSNLYETNCCLYVLAFGFVWAKTTIRLIVAHMTKGELYLTDSCLIGPMMLLMNQYFNYLLPEYYVLWLCFLYNLYDLVAYSCKVCLQICTHLQIYLFQIGKRQQHQTASTSSSVQISPILVPTIEPRVLRDRKK